jgi:hypothetical protein
MQYVNESAVSSRQDMYATNHVWNALTSEASMARIRRHLPPGTPFGHIVRALEEERAFYDNRTSFAFDLPVLDEWARARAPHIAKRVLRLASAAAARQETWDRHQAAPPPTWRTSLAPVAESLPNLYGAGPTACPAFGRPGLYVVAPRRHMRTQSAGGQGMRQCWALRGMMRGPTLP